MSDSDIDYEDYADDILNIADESVNMFRIERLDKIQDILKQLVTETVKDLK